jgi:hypothetical protein
MYLPRFRLRTLMIAVAVAAVVFAIWRGLLWLRQYIQFYRDLP